MTILVIALAGLCIRLAAAGSVPCAIADSEPGCRTVTSDSVEYVAVSERLADGEGFTRSDGEPGAHHPPLLSSYLAVWRLLGVGSDDGLRNATAALGALTVIGAAHLGRRLAGPPAGIAVAVLVAVHPALWINDIMLMSEGPYQLALVGVLAASYHLWARRTIPAALLLGAIGGVAALTRSEAVVLAPVVAAGLALGMVGVTPGRRVALVGAVAASTVALVAPWVGHNLVRFDEPVLLTTTTGASLVVANDPISYHAPRLGHRTSPASLVSGDVRARATTTASPVPEPTVDAVNRRWAMSYVRANVGRAPVVALARVGLTWGVYRPGSMVPVDTNVDSRPEGASRAGWWAHAVVTPVGVVGLVLLWRRRVPIGPFVVLVALALAVVAGNVAVTRLRVGSDLALTIAAGVAVGVAVDAFISSRRAGTPSADPHRGRLLAGPMTDPR